MAFTVKAEESFRRPEANHDKGRVLNRPWHPAIELRES